MQLTVNLILALIANRISKGTEPLAENKTAKASAIASGLVLTNAADSVQDNSSNSQQDNGTEPLARE